MHVCCISSITVQYCLKAVHVRLKYIFDSVKLICKLGFCLLKSKKAFMKASEEAEVAMLAHQKADQDMANSRLVIEKVNQD